jgi:hypothetical protein
MVETCGELMYTGWSTFRFHTLRRMTSLAEDPAESQEDF